MQKLCIFVDYEKVASSTLSSYSDIYMPDLPCRDPDQMDNESCPHAGNSI
jgi:hypothetical protein